MVTVHYCPFFCILSSMMKNNISYSRMRSQGTWVQAELSNIWPLPISIGKQLQLQQPWENFFHLIYILPLSAQSSKLYLFLKSRGKPNTESLKSNHLVSKVLPMQVFQCFLAVGQQRSCYCLFRFGFKVKTMVEMKVHVKNLPPRVKNSLTWVHKK